MENWYIVEWLDKNTYIDDLFIRYKTLVKATGSEQAILKLYRNNCKATGAIAKLIDLNELKNFKIIRKKYYCNVIY